MTADLSPHQANRSNAKPQSGLSKRTGIDTASKRAKKENTRDHFSDEQWHDMVATCAYYRAQQRTAGNGSAEQDWHEAEALLRERFSSTDIEKIAGSRGEATNIETKGE
jgi:hypothetical protein